MRCPKCGSENCQIITETQTTGKDYSIGKGLCGWCLTGGNPRKINRLGDMALLVGYAEKLSHIDDEVVVNLNSELIPT